MSDSNWPTNSVHKHSSSHPEADKSLYPSRLARIQINPHIPRDLESWLRDFVTAKKRLNRRYTLQDAVTEALEIFRGQIDAESARLHDCTTARVPVHSPPEESARAVVHSEELVARQGDNESARVPVQSLDQIDLDPDDLKDIDDRSSGSIGEEESARAVVQSCNESFAQALRDRIPHHSFQTWMQNEISLRIEGDKAILSAMHWVVRDHVEAQFPNELRQAIAAVHAGAWEWEAQAESPAVEPNPVEKILIAGDLEEELLAFFSVITDKQVDAKDRAMFQTVRQCKPDSVRLGILRSQISCMGRRETVGSFKYCVKSINQVEKAGATALRLLGSTEQQFLQLKQMNLLGGSVSDLEGKK